MHHQRVLRTKQSKYCAGKTEGWSIFFDALYLPRQRLVAFYIEAFQKYSCSLFFVPTVFIRVSQLQFYQSFINSVFLGLRIWNPQVGWQKQTGLRKSQVSFHPRNKPKRKWSKERQSFAIIWNYRPRFGRKQKRQSFAIIWNYWPRFGRKQKKDNKILVTQLC